MNDRLIAIGGSSGSLDPMMKILSLLRPGFSIPIIIVMHRGADSDDSLAQVLQSRTKLVVKDAEEKEPIKPGFVYTAPADYHVLVENDHSLSLDVSEKVNYSRPSIDVTFESAALVYRERLTCIILSGANADGASSGAYAEELGASIIVQDPALASVSFMPDRALAVLKNATVLSIEKIAGWLNEW